METIGQAWEEILDKNGLHVERTEEKGSAVYFYGDHFDGHYDKYYSFPRGMINIYIFGYKVSFDLFRIVSADGVFHKELPKEVYSKFRFAFDGLKISEGIGTRIMRILGLNRANVIFSDKDCYLVIEPGASLDLTDTSELMSVYKNYKALRKHSIQYTRGKSTQLSPQLMSAF